MTTEISIKAIYWNKGLSDYYFRTQAFETLEELIRRSSMTTEDTLNKINEATEFDELDDVEEDLYAESVEYCADLWDIELADGEDEDEEDENEDEDNED